MICEVGITAPFVCALYHSIRHILSLLKLSSHLYPTIIVNQREDISTLLGWNEICFSCILTPVQVTCWGNRWHSCRCAQERKGIIPQRVAVGHTACLANCDISGTGRMEHLPQSPEGL